MSGYGKGTGYTSQSFLPEDYLQQKADRRMGVVTLILFAVVMFGVTGAFFFTNRERTEVRREQERINREFAAEAKKIEQLKVLEAQKAEMLEKAEITQALIEKVPRSILLAELINRMPEELTLTEFGLVGKRIQDRPATALPRAGAAPAPRSLAGNKAPPAVEPPKPKPPRYEFKLELIGLAAKDEQVADYQAALQRCELLGDVDLIFSGDTTVDEVAMRKFRMEARLKADADARQIEPLQIPRLASLPGSSATAIASDGRKGEGDEEPAEGAEEPAEGEATVEADTSEESGESVVNVDPRQE